MPRKKQDHIDPEQLAHAPDAIPGGLRCAFSEKRTIKIGAGTTARKQEINVFWYVEQIGPDRFALWALNPNYVPTGERRVVGKDELLRDYHPELQYYNKNVHPAVTEMTGAVHRGDKLRRVAKFEEAVEEYDKALALDVENVRAVFGLGLSHLQRRDSSKAMHVFHDLIGLKAAFDPEHKHLFNEMGIELRKNSLKDEAIALYGRALEFTRDDDHLYYNLARAHYERGDWPDMVRHLAACLGINPGLEEARDLAELVLRMAETPKLLEKYNKPLIPPEVQGRLGEIMEKVRREA